MYSSSSLITFDPSCCWEQHWNYSRLVIEKLSYKLKRSLISRQIWWYMIQFWGTFIRLFFVENSTLSGVSCIPPVSKGRIVLQRKRTNIVIHFMRVSFDFDACTNLQIVSYWTHMLITNQTNSRGFNSPCLEWNQTQCKLQKLYMLLSNVEVYTQTL